ncbi:hypothetical protein GCM10028820_18260 [Tessaracoccus terricola]
MRGRFQQQAQQRCHLHGHRQLRDGGGCVDVEVGAPHPGARRCEAGMLHPRWLHRACIGETVQVRRPTDTCETPSWFQISSWVRCEWSSHRVRALRRSSWTRMVCDIRISPAV